MISTAMENVVEDLKRTNPGLAYDQLHKFNISTTRSALAVHPDNPLRYISLSTLKLLLTGSIHNWQQLGWRDRPIEVVMVRPGGGIQLSLVYPRRCAAFFNFSSRRDEMPGISITYGTRASRVEVRQSNGAER